MIAGAKLGATVKAIHLGQCQRKFHLKQIAGEISYREANVPPKQFEPFIFGVQLFVNSRDNFRMRHKIKSLNTLGEAPGRILSKRGAE